MLLALVEAGLKLHKGKLLERDRVKVRDPKIGRPDILHQSLLNVFQTPAMYAGLLDVLVHTRDDKIIRIARSRRPPKRYERFRGLIEQLLKRSRVPPEGESILRISNETLADALSGYYVVGLTSRGKLEDPIDLLKRLPEDSAFVIGMFPHGYFRRDVDELFNERVAISRYGLNAWVVVARIVYAIERRYGVL